MKWTRRKFITRSLLSAGVVGLAQSTLSTGSTTAIREEIQGLYHRCLSGDALVYNEDYSSGIDDSTLEAIKHSRITYAFYDVSITPSGRSFESSLRSLHGWNKSIARHPSVLVKARNCADIERAKNEGKHALVYLFQDATPIGTDLGRLDLFYDLGLRVLQLTHNNRNLVGDGYLDRVNGGLSDFGARLVERLNRMGILIDLSHCAERTTLDAIRRSTRPCAFTHTGCKAILPTERNKTDEEIRVLADRGGVIGIFNMSCWLTDRNAPEVDDLVRHIDHAVRIAGIDHVGFGSDGPMGGVARLSEELAGHVQFYNSSGDRRIYASRPTHVRVPALNGPDRLLVLADALARKGYASYEIEKIIGANFLRLFREVVG